MLVASRVALACNVEGVFEAQGRRLCNSAGLAHSGPQARAASMDDDHLMAVGIRLLSQNFLLNRE